MLKSIEKEQIFKLCFTLKKLIPKSQIFYVVFMLIKYITPYLITHNIRNFPNHSLLFDQVFARLILFQDNASYYLHPCYAWISVSILCLMWIVFLLFTITYQYYKSKKYKTDLVLFGIPSTKIAIRPLIKAIVRVIVCCCIVLMLFSQHIVEYLSLGIFSNVLSLFKEDYFIPEKLEQLKVFQRTLPLNKIVIALLNLITIALLYICSFFFLGLISSRSIKSKYGNQALPKKKILFWFILLFQFQGFYSINYYLSGKYHDQYRLYLCIVFVVILGVFNFGSLRTFNFRSTSSVFLIDFMQLVCFISGILELIQYFVSTSPLPFHLSLIRALLEVGNALIIVRLIKRRDRIKSIEYISKRIFNSDITATSSRNDSYLKHSEYLIEFHCLIAQYLEGKEVLDALYYSFVLHFETCDKETCYCKPMLSKLKRKKYKDEKKEIIHILNLITERDIVMSILHNRRHRNVSSDSLIILHIDYVYSILNNRYMTMYMCQYYLLTSHHFISNETAYIIYEIYRMNLEDIKAKCHKKNKYIISNNEIKELNHIKEPKSSKSQKLFLTKIFTLDKMKKLMLSCCSEYEDIIKRRRAGRVNLKAIAFKCEEFLNSILVYKHHKELLIEVLDEYLFTNSVMDIGEECYLLNLFFLLFRGYTPIEYNNKIPQINSFTQVFNDVFYINHSFMILAMTMSDEFIIQYATTAFLEEIHYTKNEIIGSNFHSTILNGPFVEAHFAQMKMFLTNSSNKMKKETFVITKDHTLYPVYVTIKPLPSKINLSMIISFKPYYSARVIEGNCFAYLDKEFQFVFTSKSFEKVFLFNSKKLNEANISYLELFGVGNSERILTMNRYEHNFNTSKKTDKWSSQFKKAKTIQATVPSERHQLYYYDQSLVKAPKVVIEDKLMRKTFSSSLAKIKLMLQGSGLDQEWLKSIDGLYNEISHKITHNQYANLKDIIYILKLELKRISNMHYFISTITENKESKKKLPLKRDKEFKKKNDKLVSQTCFPSITLDQNLLFFNSNERALLPPDRTPNNNNSRKLNKDNSYSPLNDSNLPFFSNRIKELNSRNKLKGDKIISQTKEMTQKHAIHQSTSSLRKMIKCLNYFSFVFYISTVIIIVINVFFDQSTYQLSQNLFYINNYSFLLIGDILFAGIGCLRSCLIVNNILSGNYDVIQSRVKLRASDMLRHYHQLTFYINSMSSNKDIHMLYELLHSNDWYSIMLPSLAIKKRYSSFNDEVYQFYFYLSNYNPVTQDKCRVEELFYNSYHSFSGNINDEFLNKASIEESTIHYVLTNIIFIMGNKFTLLSLETYAILKNYINDSLNDSVIITSFILCAGVGLNLIVLISLILIKVVFRVSLSNIFLYVNGEDGFFEEVKQLKDLLSNFSSEQCQLFENKKDEQLKKKQTSIITESLKEIKHLNDSKSSLSLLKAKKTLKPKQKQQDKTIEDAKNSVKDEALPSRHLHFNNFAQLNQMKIAFALTLLLLLFYISVEVGNMVITGDRSNQKLIDHSLSISVLSRVPKLGELILYAAVSFINRDMFIMTKHSSEYNQYVASNYYNISLDLEKDSSFTILGDSYYSFIYYQIYIARANIKAIIQDNSQERTIPITRHYDILFNEKDNLCIQLPLLYVKYTLEPSSLVKAFEESSILTDECRGVAGGINLSGLTMALNYLLKQFTDLYIEVFYKPPEERTVHDFFGHNAYSQMDEDIQTTFKRLHNAMSFLIEEDMINSYALSSKLEIVFSILSILFSCVLIIVIIFVYVVPFQKHNDILEDFLVDMNESINRNRNNL